MLATDVSEACVAAMEDRFQDAPAVEIAQADLRTFEPDKQFDSVVMINVLERIEDDVGTLVSLSALPPRPGARP